MIEINLLPEERRPVERTPLPRLISIFAGVILGFVQVLFLIQYYMISIPNRLTDIRDKTNDRDAFKAQADRVDGIEQSIQKLEKVRKTLGELESDRVCWARILDRLADSFPEGLWLKELSISYDRAGPLRGQLASKYYSLKMSGFAAGDTDTDQRRNVTEFIRKLSQNFLAKGMPPTGTGPAGPASDTFDYDAFLGVRAFEPELQYMRPIKFSAPMAKKGEAKIAYPLEGTEFACNLMVESIPFGFKKPEQKGPPKPPPPPPPPPGKTEKTDKTGAKTPDTPPDKGPDKGEAKPPAKIGQ